MGLLILTTVVTLSGLSLLLVLYPIWQRTYAEVTVQRDQPGPALAEIEARYQAALAAIKNLAFDFEMGKVSSEDHHLLLHKAKIDAAKIKQRIELLSTNDIDYGLEAEIERLVADLKRDKSNRPKALQRKIEAEIASLRDEQPTGPGCPHCRKANQPGDAFCSDCGHPLLAHGQDICPDCGYAFQPDDAYCSRCGSAFTTAGPGPRLKERLAEPSI